MRKLLFPVAAVAALAFPHFARSADVSYSNMVTGLNPLIYLQLDETSGTTANNTANPSMSGSYSSAATLTLGQASAAPVLGTAVSHSAVGTATTPVLVQTGLGAGSPSTVGAGAFTIEFWFKANTTNSGARQDLVDLNRGAASPDSDFGIFQFGSQLQVFHNVIVVNNATAPTFTIGTWHYLVYTRDSGVGTLYLDNQLYGTGADTSSLTDTTNEALGLGGKTFSNNRSFNGLIDEFAFYDKALTVQNRTDHFAAVPEPATLSLIGLAGLGLLGRRRRR